MNWVEVDGAGESWVHGLVIVIDFIRKNVLNFIPFLKKYVFIIWICYNHSLEVKYYFQQHMTEREMQKGYIYNTKEKAFADCHGSNFEDFLSSRSLISKWQVQGCRSVYSK